MTAFTSPEAFGAWHLAITVASFRLQLDYPIELWPTPQRLERASEREKLAAAIIDHGSVSKACAFLGLNRPSVYRFSWQHPDFAKEFLTTRSIAAEALYDECIEIADDPALDPHTKRIKIETRMRVAGKLIPRLADNPMNIHFNDNRQVVITDEKRAELQDRLQKLMLGDRKD